MNCSVCGVANEAGGKFCGSCGRPLGAEPAQAPPHGAFGGTVVMASAAQAQAVAHAQMHAAQAAQQPQGAAPPPQMQPQQAFGPQICASCGATLANGRCDRCGGQQGVAAPAPIQGIHWVQIRLAIKCATCQRASPLNRLDTDGRFYCYGCGRDMFFDADLWDEHVFDLASGLGDAYWALAGVFPPWPPSDPTEDQLDDVDADEKIGCGTDVIPQLLGKCREIGRATGGLTIEHGGMMFGAEGMRTRGCALEMSPGHPLCAKCKTPLATQVTSDGVVNASCSRCGTHETYRAPPAAKAACNELAGVLAPEHVDGREAARVAPQAGSAAMAVVCPKCGSALQLERGARVTVCAYCKTTSVVPDQIAAAGAQPGKPEPLWLAFRAPSAVRNVMIEAVQHAQSKARDKASAEASQKREEQQRTDEKQAEAKKSKTFAWLFTVIPVVLFGGVFAWEEFGHLLHQDKESKKEGSHANDVGGAATSTATATPQPSEPVAIKSCACAFGDGQSTPRVTLTLLAPPAGTRAWSLDIDRTSGFISEGSTVRVAQQAGAVLPLLAGSAPSRMGVACDTGIYVLVADKTATGWSSVNGSWKWNATLPSPSIDAADAGVPGTDYACAPLVVKNGAATLTLANGHHASLSLKDGKVH